MSIESLTSGSPSRYALAAALLGVADLALARLLSAGPVAAVLGLLVALAVLAATALAGAAAGRRGQRPGWAGALPGLAYGVVSGLSAFFQHTTLAQAEVILRSDKTRTAITAEQIMRAANAPSTHLIQFLAGALFLAVFGIIVGSLAGVMGRRHWRAPNPHAV